jgi:hypothetical protein
MVTNGCSINSDGSKTGNLLRSHLPALKVALTRFETAQQSKSLPESRCKIATEIQLVLFSDGSGSFCNSQRREPTTQILLEKLERRASLDSLSALIALLVEADHLGRRPFAIKAAGSLHKVILILAMELQGRGVAVCLIDWLAMNVLPLGAPAHLQVWMLALTTSTPQPI